LLNGRQIRLRKQSSESVFGADRWRRAAEGFEGPGDVEGRVVPEDRAFAGRVVGIGGLVEDFGGVREYKEAVGKAFGDPEELEIIVRGLGLEVEAGPLAEVRGVPPEVDGDVPDVAREDADELTLGLAKLVVKTAQHALDGEGLIILDELSGEAGGLECCLIEYFCEPTATIPKALGLD
jgi:hypothetical protein